jgi:hypothetical protein
MPQKTAEKTLARDIACCLPTSGIVTEYVQWAIRTTQAPATFHIGAILPGVAYELARRGFMMAPSGHTFRTLFALVGLSGTQKSTAIGRAQAFVRDWQAMLHGKDTDPYVQLSGSVPGILHAFGEHYVPRIGRTVAIMELEEFSQILDRRGDDFAEVLNRLYDGTDFHRQLRELQKAKKNGEQVEDVIRKPVVCGILASTPASLNRVMREHHLEGGLFSRILWINDHVRREEMQPEFSMYADHRAQVLRRWQAWSQNLEVLEGRLDQARRAKVVYVPPDAMELVEQILWEEYADRVVEGDRLGGVLMRLYEAVKTVAALYATSRGHFNVTDEDIMPAVNLIRKCQRSAERVHAGLATNETYRLQVKVSDFLQRCGPQGANKRKLYQQFRAVKSELDIVLVTLAEQEVVYAMDVPASGRGGRPGRCFVHEDFVAEDGTVQLH